MTEITHPIMERYYFYGRHESLPHPPGTVAKRVSGYRYRCYEGEEPLLRFISYNYRWGHAANIFLNNEGNPPKRTEPTATGKLLKKVLPKNIGKALVDVTPPPGWKLTLFQPEQIEDPFLLLCGALMTIEIQRW